MKWRLPHEAAIILQLHLEEGIRQRGEIVVVDAGVDKSCRDAELADVILYCELGGPHRQCYPVGAEDGMVWHAGIDIMSDAGSLGSVRTRFADGHFIAPVDSVDEGDLGSKEEPVQQGRPLWASEIAFDKFDIGQRLELFGYEAFPVPNLGPNMPADGRCSSNEGGGLPSSRVDSRDDFLGHYQSGAQTVVRLPGRRRN